MATGIGSLSANLSDISSNDIQSTEEIEEEKANKLEQYENAKRIAQENLENAQAKREEAIQNILQNYQNDETKNNDIVLSDLDNLIKSNDDINEKLSNLDTNIVNALTSSDNSVVSIIGEASSAIKLAIDSYADTNNPLHETVKDVLNGISTANSKIDSFNSEFYTASATNISNKVSGIYDLLTKYTAIVQESTSNNTQNNTQSTSQSTNTSSNNSPSEPYKYYSGGDLDTNTNDKIDTNLNSYTTSFFNLPDGQYQFDGRVITDASNRKYVRIQSVSSNDKNALGLVNKYIPLATLEKRIGFKEGQTVLYDSVLNKIIDTKQIDKQSTDAGVLSLGDDGIDFNTTKDYDDYLNTLNDDLTIPAKTNSDTKVNPNKTSSSTSNNNKQTSNSTTTSYNPSSNKSSDESLTLIDDTVNNVLDLATNTIKNNEKTEIEKYAPLMDQRILDAFNKLGFKYIVDEDFKLGEGYFNAKSQSITLAKRGSDDIYHELGHFLGFITGNSDTANRFRQIYNQEKSNFKGTYRGYANTSPSEYFAECVREYILNNSQLRSWVPQSYAYIKEMIDKVTPERIEQVKKTYQKIWAAYGNNQYAKGTLSAKRGIAEVFEDGPEIITTSKGTFVPFQGGEGVIPAKQTQTLLNLSKAFTNGSLKLQMPDMSGYQLPTGNTQVNSTNNNINIDSLITINGNADANTVGEIKQIAQQLVSNKQFQENVTQFVSKRQAADGRMAGKRISVI